MKLVGESLVFDDVGALESFYNLLDLQGVLSLAEDLNDNTDKVLIKGGTPFKQSFFDKLREIRGSYKENFAVHITPPLTAKICEFLAADSMAAIEDWSFFHRLYDIQGHRYQSYFRNAFRNRRIALPAFILRQEHGEMYRSMLNHGILTLAIIMYQYARIKRIHIHAFLSGFLLGIGDPDGNLSRAASESGEALDRLKKQSMELAGSMGAPKICVDVIGAQVAFTELAGELPPGEVADEAGRKVSIEEFLASEGSEETASTETEVDPFALEQIREALKFARYVLFLRDRIGADAHGVEEISYRTAYSAQKGFFELKLVEPILRIFKEYEIEIRAMMKVGELESMCRFPPSAWAYPKPRPAQMICRFGKIECPLIKTGWDLIVVSPQDAYGYIGMSLDPGRYMKCKLEDDLKGVFERHQVKK